MMRFTGKALRRGLGVAALATAMSATAAVAQVTAAQQDALRQSCRSDFMSHCSGVTPGGKEALACLQKNVAVLSPACKGAVSAIGAPAPAAEAPPKAAAAPSAAQQQAMKQACRSDFMAKCAGVSPGGKDALACLQKNVATLAPSCKMAVAATMGAPAAAPAAAVAAPAAGPTAQQKSALKFTCRGDFRRLCRGVPQGGVEAIGCLQRNETRLTPDCKTSLADVLQAMPDGAVPATATTTTTAARGASPPAAGHHARRPHHPPDHGAQSVARLAAGYTPPAM